MQRQAISGKTTRGVLIGMINRARTRAQNENMAFDLNLHVWELERRLAIGKCELSGVPLCFSERRGCRMPSIDRVDSGRGYTHDNVRIVALCLNLALSTWSQADVLAVMRAWVAKSVVHEPRKNTAGLERKRSGEWLMPDENNPNWEYTGKVIFASHEEAE